MHPKLTAVLALLVTVMVLLAACTPAGQLQPTAVPTPSPSPLSPTPTTFPVNSFLDCVAAGFPVMESYPRQCATEDGRSFTEDIGNELEKLDLIRIDAPRPNATVSSPLTIQGEARGTWFFEADFPVVLTDWDGKIIAELMRSFLKKNVQ